jgi:hypothetical protein
MAVTLRLLVDLKKFSISLFKSECKFRHVQVQIKTNIQENWLN